MKFLTSFLGITLEDKSRSDDNYITIKTKRHGKRKRSTEKG
jgi:hypothetical protein